MADERSGFNNLVVEAYAPYSATRRADPGGDLANAEGITLDTHYPDGLYGPAEFFVPRDPAADWPFAGNDRLVIRNGQNVVWEGALAGTGYVVGDGATQGRKVIGEGYWSWLFGARGLNKPWADNRVSADAWFTTASPYNSSDHAGDKGTWDRQDRLRLTPKSSTAWALNTFERINYWAPAGERVRRVTYTDDLQEGALTLNLVLFSQATASNILVRASSGSAANDVTFATPSQKIMFFFSTGATARSTARPAT